MGSYANILTPRREHKLWTSGRKTFGLQKHTFAPTLLFSGQYTAPPPPKPKEPPPPPKATVVTTAELMETAAELRREAESLVSASASMQAAASLRIQLGMLLLSKDDYIKKLLKDWDTKGKGEFLKGEFRLNLRNTGIIVTSQEADDLFDSWDEDKGGSLDLGELKAALTKVQEAARAFRDLPDPNKDRVDLLNRRASEAEEAASACAAADRAEEELEQLKASLLGRADVQLGALLYRRKVKPGAVVTHWAKSKGEVRTAREEREGGTQTHSAPPAHTHARAARARRARGGREEGARRARARLACAYATRLSPFPTGHTAHLAPNKCPPCECPPCGVRLPLISLSARG